MKKIRITIYVITLLYVLATVFFHVDFMYKRAVLYFLIALLIVFDLLIPNLKNYFNKNNDL